MTAIDARAGTLVAMVSIASLGATAPAVAQAPATCASAPGQAAQTIVTPAATTQDRSQVVEDIRKVVPDAVAPEQGAPAAGVAPALLPDATSVRSRGSLTAIQIARDPALGFSIGSGDGAICATPTRVGDKATDGALVGEDAFVFANTDRSTSTVLRPTATGTESFTVMQDVSAPTRFSWRLTLGKGQQLTTLPDGRVAVVNPRPAAEPGTVLSMLDFGSDAAQPGAQAPAPEDAGAQAQAVGDTGAQLAETAQSFDEAQRLSAGEVVLVFPKPWALDAARRPVPVTLSASDDIVTMTVDRDHTAAFPVVASPAPTASAAAVGGPMRSLTFNSRGQYPNGGPSRSERGGSAAEFEAHDQRLANVIYNQLGATDTRGYVPSVAGLQEVCRSDFNRILEILDQRDPAAGWDGEFQRIRGGTRCPGGDFGNAIMRNVPLVTGGTLVATDYEVYAFQMGEARGYIRDRLNIRGRSVFTFNTHLADIPQALFGLFGDRQTAQLAAAADERSDFPRLVMGDLNLSYQRPAERAVLTRFFYDRGYGEVDSDSNAPTFPSNDPVNKLDYIFYSKAQSSLNGGSVKPIDTDPNPPCDALPCTSDHRPLVGSPTVTG